MIQTILERLPPVQEQPKVHQTEQEHRPRSRSPRKDRQRSIVSTQMKDLSRSKLKPLNGKGSGYVAEQ